MNSVRELWQLLTGSQRRTAIFLLGLMVVGSILETMGIGLVVPLLGLITDPDPARRYPVLGRVIEALGNPSRERFIITAMLTVLGVYLAKTAYIAFMTWRQFSFLATVQVDLSQRLFASYLARPYSYHLQRNSAELIRNVMSEVALVNTGLTSVLAIIAETMMVVGIAALLVAMEPVGAVSIVLLFGVAGWAFHKATRHWILAWGQARQHHDLVRQQHLMQGLSGVKDVKLLGREASFLALFLAHNGTRARVEGRQLTLQALPRLLLELLVIGGLVALVLATMARGRDLQALIPVMGLFGVAAFRLMPSANRIIGAVQSVRFVGPSIRVVHEEVGAIPVASQSEYQAPLAFNTEIALDLVTFQYEGAAAQALHDVTLRIPRGSSIGIIGGSGAGKSTLVDIILGLLTPSSGAVKVDGVDIRTNSRGWQNHIGYVPQSIYLTDDTLRRNVAFGLADEAIDEVAVRRAIHAAQLDDFIRELPLGLDTVVGERGVRISGGQRQRIGIARALYHDPSVLVLDEATSSLDAATERDVMETVRTLHGAKTLIIVAHRLNTVEQCDRLVRLKRGSIVEEGGTAQVLHRAISPTG